MSPELDENPTLILDFWFEEVGPEGWFVKDQALDARIKERFSGSYDAAAAGDFDHWQESAPEALALVILLDQFPRNMFRDTPRAFATDGKALAAAKDAIARDLDRDLTPGERQFLYMPFQHSEDLADQVRSVDLFAERVGDEKTLDFAKRHLAVIERFGRFPHRNAILGRRSTSAETEYLAGPEAGF